MSHNTSNRNVQERFMVELVVGVYLMEIDLVPLNTKLDDA